MFESIGIRDCINLLKIENSMAGTYDLMDLISLKVIERSQLKTVVFKSTIDNLTKVILENKKIGTEIII
jgi:uridylate kinase